MMYLDLSVGSRKTQLPGMAGMPFSMLIDNILSLRGSNPAKVKVRPTDVDLVRTMWEATRQDCLGQFKMFKIVALPAESATA